MLTKSKLTLVVAAVVAMSAGFWLSTMQDSRNNETADRINQKAQDEAAHGNRNRARKAYSYIVSLTRSSKEDIQLFNEIEKIMFPKGATTQNEKNDVEIVFNARKYGCILVTNDGDSRRQPGGILGNRDKLLQLGIKVLTDKEAVAFIKQCIIERDNLEREKCNITGQTLPDWVGND